MLPISAAFDILSFSYVSSSSKHLTRYKPKPTAQFLSSATYKPKNLNNFHHGPHPCYQTFSPSRSSHHLPQCSTHHINLLPMRLLRQNRNQQPQSRREPRAARRTMSNQKGWNMDASCPRRATTVYRRWCLQVRAYGVWREDWNTTGGPELNLEWRLVDVRTSDMWGVFRKICCLLL